MRVMIKIKTFLADTYALVEIIKGNNNYKDFLDYNLITTKLNIMELYYHCLRYHDQEVANRYLKLFFQFVVPISIDSIKMGMQFKLKYRKEKLSYIDCVGYALASELGIKFLTGDCKFEDKQNVEFVK